MGIKKSLALKWSPEEDDAPRIIASGKGALAERILELAKESGIPIEENIILTEALADSPVGMEIPRELYSIAAELYLFLMELDQSQS